MIHSSKPTRKQKYYSGTDLQIFIFNQMMSIKMHSDPNSLLEQLDVEDYKDCSEYLVALVTGDMLNQGAKECEM